MRPVFLTRIPNPRAVLFLAVCLLVLLASSLSPTPAAHVPNSRLAILPELETPVPLCGTPRLIELRDSLRAATPLPRGAGLDFLQQPPILTTSYTGRVTIRDLGIVGDFATVKFHRVDHRRPKGVHVETWRRTRRQRIGGQTISRFTKSWPASIFREVIRSQSFGWDRPQVFWGTLKARDAEVPIRLRLASKNLPTAIVRKIHPRVQYSSHVVNLVVNNFSNARVSASDDSAFAFVAAAQLFYQHFPDVYDGLSFVMQRDVLADYGAFHRIVRNPVGGIGLPLFNDAPRFGSRGRLKALEVYRAGHIATNRTSTHEAMHQWGDYFDLTELAGVEEAGHQPFGHMPLMFPRENYIGAVLEGTRRVRRVGGDVYRIQRTPSPIRQHPLHLYAMGKVAARAVPNIVVFDNQDQFDASTSTAPPVNTRLRGGTRIVTMSDILGRYGPRTGPVQRVWRRATILISVGRLATPQEMNYWNFFAKRTGEHANTTSFQGYPAFRRSTGNRMRLRTDIDALGRPKVTQRVQTTFRNFSPRDWRGVVFARPVPSRFRVNQSYRLSGRVTVTDRAYHAALLYIAQADGTSRRADVAIKNGRFSATLRFPKRGNWVIRVFLFYPGSGPQYPVTSLTGVIVT